MEWWDQVSAERGTNFWGVLILFGNCYVIQQKTIKGNFWVTPGKSAGGPNLITTRGGGPSK